MALFGQDTSNRLAEGEIRELTNQFHITLRAN